DEVRLVIEVERFHVLVLNLHFVGVREIGGERGKPERWEERIFDRPPERTRRFCQSGKDHFDLHRSAPAPLCWRTGRRSSATPITITDMQRSCGPSSSTRNTCCHRPSSS